MFGVSSPYLSSLQLLSVDQRGRVTCDIRRHWSNEKAFLVLSMVSGSLRLTKDHYKYVKNIIDLDFCRTGNNSESDLPLSDSDEQVTSRGKFGNFAVEHDSHRQKNPP